MKRALVWFAIGYAMIVSMIIIAAGVGGTNEVFGFVTRLPYGDKLGHFGLMGMLALLADLAARHRSLALGPLVLPLAPSVVAGLVLLEELSQLWLPSRRSFDLWDLIADALGIALFVLAGRMLVRRAGTKTGPCLSRTE